MDFENPETQLPNGYSGTENKFSKQRSGDFCAFEHQINGERVNGGHFGGQNIHGSFLEPLQDRPSTFKHEILQDHLSLTYKSWKNLQHWMHEEEIEICGRKLDIAKVVAIAK